MTALHQHLDILIQKYHDNEYMSARLLNYMEHLLPSALEGELNTHLQREERKQNLSNNRDEFVSRFLHKNNYYFSTQTELFLNYDGVHFVIYSEDDILHQILSTITHEQDLMPWKHKIKINILKQIREKSPLNAIPESATIQYVIDSLHPAIFSTKNHAKYFLTIIGDCILGNKEASALVYIAPPACKELLREIGNQCYTYFGLSNIFNTIKFKYYDHNYEQCRLIPINKHTNKSKSLPIPQPLLKHMLDVLCVSAHYSSRYGSADKFLEQCSEPLLIDHALVLHKNTPVTIVDKFFEKSIKYCPGSKINSKNMIFLWKKFLEEKELPNIVFYENLKTLFKKKWAFSEEEDSFLDATSIYLPLVATFNKFWETTIVSEDDEDSGYDLEVDELSSLFKKWTRWTSIVISDSMLIELIKHFYPDVTIVDDKYILNIKCNLWDKRKEIIDSLELYKNKIKTNESSENVTKSLYEAYEFYSADNREKSKHVASKQYFEKVASEIINTHIDGDGLISPTWWK